jgi:hypothetical protein
MYEAHNDLTCPSDTTRLWRFMDIGKFLFLLQTSVLYFCRQDLLRDPYEGLWNDQGLRAYSSHPNAIDVKGMQMLLNEQRRWMYVSSWHMNEFESAAMWELYLKTPEGIAIETDFARFRDCFSAEPFRKVFISEVKYIDYEKEPIPWNSGFFVSVHKRKSFEHERELRALVWSLLEVKPDNPDQKEMTLDPSKNPPGIDIKVNLGKLMRRVFVSPAAGSWYVEIVRSILEKYGYVDVPVMQSSLYSLK